MFFLYISSGKPTASYWTGELFSQKYYIILFFLNNKKSISYNWLIFF